MRDTEHLLSTASLGPSYEGYVIEELLRVAERDYWEPTYYRTSNGAELDLVLQRGMRTVAFEVKWSRTPKLSKGFHAAREAVAPERTYVVVPGRLDPAPMGSGVEVVDLSTAVDHVKALSAR